MQRINSLLVACLCLFGFVQAKVEAKQIQWLTNYDEGVKQAQASSKPLVVLFTGSDWCTWCKKLEQEVLNRPEFADAIADRFIFVKLDFPMNKSVPADQTARNKQLQKQMGVAGYPTIVVLNADQRQVGTVGYRPGGPAAYADYLLKMVGEHGTYQQKVATLGIQQLEGIELLKLYEQALVAGDDIDQIMQYGLKSDQKLFFLLEKYKQLAEQGRLKEPAALQIKEELLALDPNNQSLVHYQVAMIEYDNALTVASLLDYIDHFGAEDHDNLWRIEMIISQVFFDTENVVEALRHAESSYQSAPPAAQQEIASAIKQMKTLNR